jgi:hypothetical protein
MPIRFRCSYCNQLMGISRRKAGATVRCPSCDGEIVVPPAEAEQTERAGGGPAPFVFDRPDFDLGLKEAAPAAAPRPSPAVPGKVPAAPRETPAADPPADLAIDVERVEGEPARPPAPPRGIFLTPTLATLLCVAVIIALALAFAAGLLVGRFL